MVVGLFVLQNSFRGNRPRNFKSLARLISPWIVLSSVLLPLLYQYTRPDRENSYRKKSLTDMLQKSAFYRAYFII